MNPYSKLFIITVVNGRLSNSNRLATFSQYIAYLTAPLAGKQAETTALAYAKTIAVHSLHTLTSALLKLQVHLSLVRQRSG